MRGWTIEAISESLSPMTHASGTAGNESVISREQVSTPRGIAWLPVISGNAIRHRAVREPGVLWLIDRYDLAGKLTLDQMNFLLHGGNLSESTAHENTRRIAEMHRTWPLLQLLGGCLRNQVLTGCLDVWRGVLVCEENRRAFGEHAPRTRMYSAERFIGEWQYTRSDARKRVMHADREQSTDKSNLMIYSGQSVQRGALWHHGFVVRRGTSLHLGALLWSLRLWQESGGTVGGMASRGHGRLRTELLLDTDQDRVCDEYCSYADAVKDDAVAWLQEAFE